MKKYHELVVQLIKKLNELKPLPDHFYNHLYDVVDGTYYPNDEVLFKPGDKLTDIFFLSSGTAVTYIYNASGEKQVLDIYQMGEIIFNVSRTLQRPTPCYLMVCADAFLLKISYEHFVELNQEFPETGVLSRMIISARELKNLWRNQLLILPGIEKVEGFYKRYPELLQPGKVMRDSDIASYLLLAEGSLRSLRNRLIKSGVLKL